MPKAELLPHNADAERAVLGAILFDNSAYQQASRLHAGDFCLESHRTIFSAISDMMYKSVPVDLVTLTEELSNQRKLQSVGGAAYISGLTDGLPRVSNIEHYVTIVKEKAVLRSLLHACQEISTEALQGPDDVGRFLERAKARIPASANGHRSEVGTLLSEVRPERVEWLWKYRIPLGRITMLDGDPGNGKSLLSLEIAARLSNGLPLPGDESKLRGGAVILTAEDGLADTVVPRLIAAGADRSRFVAIKYCPDRAGEATVSQIPRDLPVIETAIKQVDARIVIVDVLFAYLAETTNANRDQHVRLALAPLAELAARTKTAVLCLRHLNKSQLGNPLYRGGGSIGIIGAARAGLLVGRHPDSPETYILAATKQNLGPPMPSLTYRIEANKDEVPRIHWTGESEHTAATLLALPMDGDEQGSLDGAMDFLREELAEGPRKQTDLLRSARQGGTTNATLKRAKRKLGIKSVKVGGRDGYWTWELPTA